ncbi:MAG: precorrin-2 dehydrogenase/sirohydrochlorin ferrochelatase family protein [Bacteroidota bacterium]
MVSKIFFPAAIDLSKQPVLVIGCGKVGLRKLKKLIELGIPHIDAMALNFEKETREFLRKKGINYSKEKFRPSTVYSYNIFFDTTGDPEVMDILEMDAIPIGKLVNCASEPERGNFYLPSLLKSDKTMVTFSTDGKAPFIAKYLKDEISSITEKADALIDKAEEFRRIVIKRHKDDITKQALFDTFIDLNLNNGTKIIDKQVEKEYYSIIKETEEKINA